MEGLKHKFLEVLESFRQFDIRVKAVFYVSTFLMLFQGSTGWSWDFLVYSMNGQYIFADGFFMEWLRPPVASILLGIPQILAPRFLAELLFILTASTFFLFTAWKLAQEYGLEFNYFYLLLMTPATIFYGTINGTEMLSLALAMLMFAEIHRTRSGIWLGLTFLTRYNYGVLIPLTLVQKDLRKTCKTLSLSALPVTVWLAYNYIETGHPLKSFANYLGLNILRRSAHDPLNPLNYVIIGLPASVFLLLYLRKDIRRNIEYHSTEVLYITGFTVLNSILYAVSGLKPLRYLYPLILPVAYFGTKAIQQKQHLEFLNKRVNLEKTVSVLAALSLISAGFLVFVNPLAPPENFQRAEESAGGCMVESNVWPMINYAGTPAVSMTYRKDTELIRQGYRIIDYGNSIYGNSTQMPVIEKTPLYTTYGNQSLCKKPVTSDRSWIKGLNLKTQKNYTPESFLYNEMKNLWR